MKSSQQLEHAAERSRAQLEGTLDELRAKLSPGQVVDQVVDYARDGKPGQFFSNLGQQAVNNPLPVAIIGASLAWLMMSNGSPPRPGAPTRGNGILKRGTEALSSAGAAVGHAADKASDAMGAVTDAVHSTADTLSDAAHRAGDAVSETAAHLRDSSRSTAAELSDRASSAYGDARAKTQQTTAEWSGNAADYGQEVAQSMRGFMALCREQPLILAGLGLAMGAAIGAAFPATDAENRLLGETSDALKDRVANTISGDGSSNGGAAHDGGDEDEDGSAADSPSGQQRPDSDKGGFARPV